MVRSISAPGLVGRSREVARIDRALALGLAGDPQFACLVGAAGVGKTRLLATAEDMAREQAARVLRGTCIAGGRTMPFLPLLECLTALVTDDGPDDARARLRAALVGDSVDALRPSADHVERGRLLEAVAVLLSSSPGLTVLLIDDLQWADTSTLACLEFLTQRVRSSSFVLLSACRDGPDLLPLVADGRRLARLDVPPLTADAVAEQAAEITGGGLARAELERLVARSAGNPFMVEELLAWTDGTSIPNSVDALLGARIENISPEAEELLAILALLDRPGPAPLLDAAVGGDHAAASGELELLGVVEANAEGLRLRHPLYGELVRGRLESDRRRRLHAVVADGLEAAEAPESELAHHRWEAGDPVAALPAVMAAAAVAERLLAFDEAAIQLDRTLELAARLGPTHVDDEAVADLLDRAAHAHWLAGSSTLAVQRLQAAVATKGTIEADEERAYWMAVFAWDAGDMALSMRSFARLAAGDDADRSQLQRSRAAFARARVAAAHRDFQSAAAAGRLATELAAACGACVDESSAWHVTGMSLASMGDIEAGAACLRRGLDLGRQAGSPWRIGMGYVHLAATLQLGGWLRDALATAEAGLVAVEHHGIGPAHAVDLQARAAAVLIELGDWERAERLTVAAVDGPSRALQHLVRATLAIRRGEVEVAAHQLDMAPQAEGDHAAGGPGAFAAALALRRLELALLAGDDAVSADRAAAMPTGPDLSAWEHVAAVEAQIILCRGPVTGPGQIDTPPPHDLDVRGLDGPWGHALSLEWRAERSEADGAGAVVQWRAVADLWGDAAATHRRAAALVREAEASLRQRGGRSHAAAVLEEALITAASLGADPLTARIRRIQDRAGIGTTGAAQTASPARAAGLTSREEEVLERLAEGLTNRQIADELFISVKTAGVHVTRILTKLHAHTRGEAVAIASRRGLLR